MNPEDLELEAFQSCLLDALYAHSSAAEIQDALLKHPNSSAFQDYMNEFDPEMLEVAAQLVKKWGRF
jgi:hypothetical protein